MKMFKQIAILVCLFATLRIGYSATQTINTLPSASATFIATTQIFLGKELANYIHLRFVDEITSGGFGTTSANLTHSVPEVIGFPNGFYTHQITTSHTYTTNKRTFVYLMDDSTRTITISGASITYSTNLAFAEMLSSSTLPPQPSGCLALMQVDTDGTSIIAVSDLRAIKTVYDLRIWGGSLSAAVTAIGSTSATLQYHNAVTLTASVVIPTTLTLQSFQGGIISLGNHNLTFSGTDPEAERYQIFSITGSGRVSGIKKALPEWFGVTMNGVTNDGAAWEYTYESIVAGGEIDVAAGITYTGTTELNLSSKRCTIRGTGFKTIFLSDVTGGASHFLFKLSSYGSAGTLLEDFKIQLTTSNGRGINILEGRENTTVQRVMISGNGDNPNTAVGVQTSKSSIYCGFVRITNCYFDGLLQGIDLDDTTTAASVTDNTIIGNQDPGIMANSIGINIVNTSNGIYVAGNEIEGVAYGIYSRGTMVTVVGNRFETCTKWVDMQVGSGNTRVYGAVLGNQYNGSGSNNITTTAYEQVNIFDIGNDVYLPNALYVENILGGNAVTFKELSVFDAGNFATTGAETWTVAEVDVNTYTWNIIGNQMTFAFSIKTSSVSGSIGGLKIKIPASKISKRRLFIPILSNNNGSYAIGYADVRPGDAWVYLYATAAGGGWGAATDTTEVSGSLTFPIN